MCGPTGLSKPLQNNFKMKTKIQLEKAIIKITMKIRVKYPELSKYIEEMPLKSSEDDTTHMNNKNMKEYYSSLVELFAEYSKTHEAVS
ncbi:MAG: hypothetical protein ACI9CP_000965 [Cryomorphaceae bacterium]|jgi:hypothetical protein